MAALHGARCKVDRAREHLETLDDETTRWVGTHQHRIVRKYYAKTCHITYRYAVDGRAPLLRWGIIIGDVIHELSSALDHVAYQFALRKRPKPSRSTAFPVCLKAGDWESKTTRAMIQHIGPTHRTFIKSKQPYPARDGLDPATHALAMLRLLSRIDKHRVVHTAVALPLDTDIEFINMRDISAMREFILYGGPVKQGAKFARLWVEPSGPNPDVDMNLDLSMYVAFIGEEYGHMDGGHAFTVLNILIGETAALIDEAESHL